MMALRAVEKPDTKTGGIAADRLRSIVDRIERLEEERKALGGDIRDIYAEAKSAGFDVKVRGSSSGCAARRRRMSKSRRRCSTCIVARWGCSWILKRHGAAAI
jgi:uncharacterized protein (UPF0335 family)